MSFWEFLARTDPTVLFPLSWPAKIALMLIALALGLIWSMLQWPEFWKKVFRDGEYSHFVKGEAKEDDREED